jgi:hypothetical protein
MASFHKSESQLASVLTGLETYYDSPWIRNLRLAIQNYPKLQIADAVSRQQILSKKWAIEEMHKALGGDLGMVFIVGGWYGTLAAMMFESERFPGLQIRSFDIDPDCAAIADTMNRDKVVQNWTFKAATANMCELNYVQAKYIVKRSDGSEQELLDSPDLIINSSCEHIANFDSWISRIPNGMPLVLQSNDFWTAPDHVNCVPSLEEFKKQCQLKKILFEGSLDLQDYTRFMLIGSK